MIDKKYSDFLVELDGWMPWITKRGEAPSSLKTEFPTLTTEESNSIVNEWLSTRQQLLNEDKFDREVDADSGC